MRYNPLTVSYETSDTSVPAEIVDEAQSLLDVFWVASIRQQQRDKLKDVTKQLDDKTSV